MIGSTTVLLRAGVPAWTVATRIGDALGFQLSRQPNRRMVLTGPVRVPALRLVVQVERQRNNEPPPELFIGYDTRLTVFPADPADLAAEFFDELCRVLAMPALLVHRQVYVAAAWTPMLGLRRFPANTYAGTAGRHHWADYAQPPAAGPPMWPGAGAGPPPVDRLAPDWIAPDWIAPDDVPGQRYQRVLAEPDADEPRFAYADAIADEQPEYAGLIRAQLAHNRDMRAGLPWDADRTVALHRLERSLRDSLTPTRWSHLLGEAWQVRRGFVETIDTTAEAFLRFSSPLPGEIPLRMVFLTRGADRVVDELAGSAHLDRLVGLSLWGNPIGDGGLRRLLRSPYLGRLRWLSLQNTGVTRAGIESIAVSEALPNLRYLEVDSRLRLNPAAGYDYPGGYDARALVARQPGPLADELAQRYDRAWLRWAATPLGRLGLAPEYDEV
ncbi:hypothetical protein [Dactylosporangium sp. NPDC049140]|uniref:hypothetical protein n=1 Tax=Dactylosporangium sp. NPDC049140 TaxID=3155647 RepID=UPI0033E66062